MIYYEVLADGTQVQRDSQGAVDAVEVLIANRTLTVADSGKTFSVGTDALVITLPSTLKGLEYTFQYIHADVGQNGATKDMVKEVTGLIRGNGFLPKIKPEAFVASTVADRFS